MVSFTLIINKHVGIYLLSPIFSHGQLYVAISKITSRAGLKILIIDEDGEDTNKIYNIIYKEAFRNIRRFLLHEHLFKFIIELMFNVTRHFSYTF
jgi:hypothetical protein